jgi:hypothetical protein
MKTDKKCVTCKHWYNKQRLLNYHKDNGVCLNPKFKFNTIDGRLVGVLDIGNVQDQNKITGNPSHDIETATNFKLDFSKYLLQTNEEFGCIFHE